ncbi:amino acid ABC transporter atpase [Thermoanaerobacterium thermosaccharolyticum]|uniref:Amino acid ABC transporter atpase n=1 Tax=Thermoanaerobacterium thermosaccharolyticum TaxID=1517 RepID=A0A223HWN0_THETR|nr:ABC transporter ATP-binding protein [Thermoanaerobacterium thermosaccharolyticum]AST56797.1 amino acid ABC transporter atpase [Thermoanaerobacterium thermosaccharolyticum]
MLEIKNLNVSYGMVNALKGIDLKVNDGEIVTIIGANGAGKSTTLMTISGILKPKKGHVKFNDVDITKKPAQNIVDMGICQVPEGRRIFANMTVMENLEMGAYLRKDKTVKSDMEKVFHLFPRLKERHKQIAGTLSGGEQQMLAIGRALMSKPKVLLLDEPSMGLAPIVVQDIFKTIKSINEDGTTILLVEQNAKMALSIADRAYVLETGNISLEGAASVLKNDERVKKSYLGG